MHSLVRLMVYVSYTDGTAVHMHACAIKHAYTCWSVEWNCVMAMWKNRMEMPVVDWMTLLGFRSFLYAGVLVPLRLCCGDAVHVCCIVQGSCVCFT